MSYFNFKLYTRHTKNVNTDLEYKKGDWAPGNPQKGGRAPILGYRKNLDCSGATGCQNEKIYKDNWAKTCATDPSSCYIPVIKTIQNKDGHIDISYNYTTRNLLRSRFRTYEQNAYNFDISGGLTNWGGGADPAHNAYLIHDCSCNAPFTANNPCVATYAPSNKKFAVNNAVSGRARINRLKYNTITKVKSTKTVPFSLLGYPRGSCEFCKRDFKPSKGKKGGDNKSRINSRLPVVGGAFAAAASAEVACCDETLPPGVIKLCTGFNSGSNCTGGGWTPQTYDTVGYLKNALAVWTNGSGCGGWPATPPTTGRLGNYTTAGYPDIGTMCPPNADFSGNTIGGFAWNPVDAHLWFILKEANQFNMVINPFPPPTNLPGGFQFTAIEFSSSPSFSPANTAKLYASDNVVPNLDYDTGSPYEIHWSSGVTGFNAAMIIKLNNIFGDGSVSKNVYIQFELAAFAPVPGGFTAIPGSSPSYIYVQYNQELGPAPAIGNFTIENQTKMLPMDISGINIITTSIYNDTLELEFAVDAIDDGETIEYTYSTTTSPYITNLAGTQAPNVSMEHITASQIYTKVFSDLDIYDDGILYELTATIRKVSFRVGCCADFDYSTANQPTYDLSGDLLRTMEGSFALENLVFWKVGFKFDKDLPSTTGIVYINLISDASPPGQEPNGHSQGGSGIPATPSTMTTTRIYYQSHVGPPEYPGIIQITVADEVKKFRIQMLDKADPNNNPKVLDDSLLINFNILWLDPYPSIYTVGGEFIFSEGGGWGTNGVAINVNQDPYLLKNVDPNGGADKYVGFSASSVGDPYILYCTPEGPPTYIPNQIGGLRLPVSNPNYPAGALYPMKFQVEIDLLIAGWTNMGQCDIWMSSSFNAGVPPRCTLLVTYFDLTNLGPGELNAQDLGNWNTALGGSGAYIGQTIRITYVSGGT